MGPKVQPWITHERREEKQTFWLFIRASAGNVGHVAADGSAVLTLRPVELFTSNSMPCFVFHLGRYKWSLRSVSVLSPWLKAQRLIVFLLFFLQQLVGLQFEEINEKGFRVMGLLFGVGGSAQPFKTIRCASALGQIWRSRLQLCHSYYTVEGLQHWFSSWCCYGRVRPEPHCHQNVEFKSPIRICLHALWLNRAV